MRNTYYIEETSDQRVTFENQIMALVNHERVKNGLLPLIMNEQLCSIARLKCQDMSDHGYCGHQSPIYGSPFDMLKRFGVDYSFAGENVAMGQKSPRSVMDGWMNSPSHKNAILNSNYKELGVGYLKSLNGSNYWVQLFISR